MATGKRHARKKNRKATAENPPPPITETAPRSGWRERPRWQWILALLLLLTVCSSAAAWLDWYVAIPEDRVATYAGSDSCIVCHRQQHTAWHGSDHDLAMDPATPETVLGDFSGVELEHLGFTSRMYRDGDRYMIHTEGPDGEPADYEVKYVFGFEPLQNYMVEVDRPADAAENAIGRVQVLRETWNSEKGEWYYLMPPGVEEALAADDPLHWCGQAQNWNRACAECHSTNLEKNHRLVGPEGGPYHSEYHTTFTEMDVSCEACHGPGSVHVELANAKSLFWDRKRGYGLPSLHALSAKAEVDNCGQCHSRRRQISQDFHPGDNFNDAYVYELVGEGTYWCDGQVRDEDYVYGSFLQSRMYAEGIRCGDCHEPHTTELRHQGNALCTSCHQHPAEKYDVPAHHHHPQGSAGASCVECHMPATTYMAIDARRDHSLRVPRPDLSVDLGTPNACSQCHLPEQAAYAQRQVELPRYQDWLEASHTGDEAAKDTLAQLDAWSLEHFNQWYGEKEDRGSNFAYAFHGAWNYESQALAPLLEVLGNKKQPAMIRASAVEALAPYLSSVTDYSVPEYAAARNALLAAIEDPDPRVRMAAVPLLVALPGRQALEKGQELLLDPNRGVRIEAVLLIIDQGGGTADADLRTEFRDALNELQLAMQLDSDQAMTHATLARMYHMAGEARQTVIEYEQAVALSPNLVGPREAYAQFLYRLASIKDGINKPEDAAIIREKADTLRQEELALITRDAELLPDSADVHYRYALMLHLTGDDEAAERELLRASELEPNWSEPLFTLCSLYESQGRWEELLPLATQFVERWPQDMRFNSLLLRTRQQLPSEGE